MKKCIALVVAIAACNAEKVVDLGGTQDDAMPGSTTEQGALEAGPTTPATCGFPAPSATCAYAGKCSDGSGFLADTPSTCSDPAGTPASFASVAEVASALVGTWGECGVGSASVDDFVRTISQDGSAIQFDGEGHFTLLAMDGKDAQDVSLVPGASPADKGTFEVIDASSTLGAGTYQVRLTASDGGVHTTQVVVFSSEPRLRFFAPGASDYMHAPTKQFQANVCGPPFGPIDTPSDGAEALARLKGRWARCPNPDTNSLFVPFEGMGLELPGDGTWYALVENSSGALVRSTATRDHGTVKVLSSSPPQLQLNEVLSPVIGECGTLAWVQGGPGGADSGSGADSYQYMRLP